MHLTWDLFKVGYIACLIAVALLILFMKDRRKPGMKSENWLLRIITKPLFIFLWGLIAGASIVVQLDGNKEVLIWLVVFAQTFLAAAVIWRLTRLNKLPVEENS